MSFSFARAALAVRLVAALAAPVVLAGNGLAQSGGFGRGGGLDQTDPAPPGKRGGGNTLNIPGLPPIQLPPGARAFGLNGPGVDDQPARPAIPQAGPDRNDPRRDRREADRKAPERIAPHSVPTNETQRAKVLDALYARLKAADDHDDAKGVAGAIERVWLRSGSDTADLLMARANAAMAAHETKIAEALLDSIVALEPGWAEGWNKRAMLRFNGDNIDGAVSDLEHVLKIEPRHFVALAGLGAILHKSGLDKRALEAYRRALDLYPQQPDIRKSVEQLQIEVEGRDI